MTDAQLLRATYAEAERAFARNEITATQWHRFRALWRSSAPRFSTVAAEFDGPYQPENEPGHLFPAALWCPCDGCTRKRRENQPEEVDE